MPPTMHLDNASRAEVGRILGSHLEPQVKVYAFGSRVHGRNLKPFSDLDLCLRADAPLPATILSKLNAAFEDSTLPFKVDIVDWETISPEFRAAIEADLAPLT